MNIRSLTSLFRHNGEPEEPWNAYILRPHQLETAFFDEESGQALGPAYMENGKLVHWLQQTDQGLVPLIRASNGQPNVSPSKLYRALSWKAKVAPVYYPIDGLLDKLNSALMLGLVGVLVFFLYLIFTNVRGE